MLRFLAWFCPPDLYESIEGDLVEQFQREAVDLGVRAAKNRLIWNVIKFFRPEIILRNKFSVQLINIIMLGNYFTIARRNVMKNKTFSSINIVGLAIGLAACLLIFQFVSYELSYDKFNEKFERTYRITNDRFQNGKLIQHGTIMYPTIGPTMAKDYEEIELYTRLMPGGEVNVKVNERIFSGEQCLVADERFLSVFTFPLLAGDKYAALKDRYAMVITERTAKKYFEVSNNNYADIVGKTLYSGLDPQPYTVKGICPDVPSNSHLQFDVLISYSTLISPDQHDADDSWTWSDMRHYLVLKPGTNYKQLESKFPAFSDRYFKGDKVSGSVEKFYLQPLGKAHLYSDYEYDIAKLASGKAVWAMLIVAIFILFIAWINYINLTTSRAIERAKEVGLRKVMGALRAQLIKQFIFESLLLTTIAFITAIILAKAFQSTFNQIVGTQLSLGKVIAEAEGSTIAIVVIVFIVGILLSGFYPAFILSAYQPVTVLKGKFQRSGSGQWLRKALVVLQFTAAGALITGTMIISRQIKFMNEADLGINLHQTIVVRPAERTPTDSTLAGRIEGFKHRLLQLNDVVSVATSHRLPGSRLGRTFDMKMKESTSSEHYTMSNFSCDYNFFDTYNIPLLEGRKFLPTDHQIDWENINVVILNRKATELLGFKDPKDVIGKQITFWGRDLNIVGVVGDFHQESLRKPKEAIYFVPTYSRGNTSIRLKSENYEKIIPDIEAAYNEFFPDNVFEYLFIEDRFKQQYDDDARFAKVVNIFTALAIVVSCLGLIGLSSYAAVQRTREIGIRKVLGASLISIVSLLSIDFIKLILLATIISLPIAYFSIQNWLEAYAYRIPLGWILFVVPIILVLVIATITMSFQIIKTAATNPARTLKYE